MPTDFKKFNAEARNLCWPLCPLIFESILNRIMWIYIIILLLSVIHSLFGVGMLIIGIPSLLLLGLSYQESLLYLLPASAALSWIQVNDFSKISLDGAYRKKFFLICLPLVFLGMLTSFYFDFKNGLQFFIIIMLLVTFFIRSSDRLLKSLQSLMCSHLNYALAFLGVVHGLSNMGGAILTPLISSLYKEKQKVLAGISYSYAFMATLQLIILFLMNPKSFFVEQLIGPLLAVFVYYIIGKRAFAFTKDQMYQRLLTAIILLSAIILILNY